MPQIETELEAALLFRQTLLLSVAQRALVCAESLASLEDLPPARDLGPLRGIVDLVEDAEALTAVVLSRAGVTWEAMAMHNGRQNLHRRLAERGEMLFQEAWAVIERSSWNYRPLLSREELLIDIRRIVRRSNSYLTDQPMREARHLAALRRTRRWWRDPVRDQSVLIDSLTRTGGRQRHTRRKPIPVVSGPRQIAAINESPDPRTGPR